ncbi:MAG: LPS export ABC transporter permease LptF [Desulfobacula sp.]|nr:LPS export ABC transporter permease LptF [Desulfobacula sp.]MDA8133788.1 LPS export ABC transporter permease LptF [Desulfobacteraceae bacterium]
MKPLSIINRYIFREFLSPFIISLFFLTFVFLMMRIPEITNKVVNFNADMSSILLLMAYMLPRFMEFTIPMSVMIAILLTFMRMSGENELLALKGAGVSLYSLLPPVLIFSLAGVVLTSMVTVAGVPWGRLSLKKKTLELARSNMDMALQERQFNSELENVMIYISQVDMKTKKITDVFIEDRRTKGVVSISIAPLGELIRTEDAIYTIRLLDGVINQVNEDEGSVNHIRFGNYDINIDLNDTGRGEVQIAKRLSEESLTDLIRMVKTGGTDDKLLRSALMQLHEKFSIPFACLSLGLLAFPLGVQSNSLQKSSGFGLGVFFFLLYYFFLAAGWSAGETGNFPPGLAMWLPDIIMGCAGIFLLVRNAKEKPVLMPVFLRNFITVLRTRIQRRT